MTTQPFLFGDTWIPVLDGNDTARTIFDRHYSRTVYADGRKPKLFLGPGEKMVLITPCARGLFAWRRFINGDGQQGINCAIFRNEGAGLSSSLILSAEKLAIARWGHQRAYTYVNPRAVRGNNPGYCFKMAGWKVCGVTKRRAYLILEKEL